MGLGRACYRTILGFEKMILGGDSRRFGGLRERIDRGGGRFRRVAYSLRRGGWMIALDSLRLICGKDTCGANTE